MARQEVAQRIEGRLYGAAAEAGNGDPNNGILFFAVRPATFAFMSNKEIVADLLGRMPTNASLHDIAREIEFVAPRALFAL